MGPPSKDTPVFPKTTTTPRALLLPVPFQTHGAPRGLPCLPQPCELQAGAWLLFQPPVLGISPAHAGDKLPLPLQTEDKEYDDLEEKFQCVASSVATLKENVASYLGHLEVKPGPLARVWPHPLRSCSSGLWNTFKPGAVGDVQGFAAELLCQGVAQHPRITQVQGRLKQS